MAFKYLIYDIESIVDRALLNRVVYAGDGLSDEAAYARELEVLQEREAGRTFVNPAFHMPIAIAAMAVREDYGIERLATLGEPDFSPESAVRKFWQIVREHNPILVDFNGHGFDLRVLELWAYRLAIALPPAYLDKFGPRYRFDTKAHLDLQEFLTNNGAVRFKGGLNLFAKLAGGEGKTDVAGDDVEGLYAAGEIEKIRNYCMQDVASTYFVFLRVQVMRGLLSASAEAIAREKAEQFLKKEEPQ